MNDDTPTLDTPATSDTPALGLSDDALNYEVFVARRRRRATRRLLDIYEPAWARGINENGYVWRTEDFPVGKSSRTVLNNLYRVRRILTREPELRGHVPKTFDMSGVRLSPVAEGIFIAPAAERVRVINKYSTVAPPAFAPPPANVVLFDDKKSYLAMCERAAIDPLFLVENDVNVQCRDLRDCAQVMADVSKLGAHDSIVREDLMMVIVVKSGVTPDELVHST